MVPAGRGSQYSEVVGSPVAPSRQAAAFLLVAGLATLGLVAAMPGAAFWRLAVSAAVIAASLEAWHRIAAHRGPRGVRYFLLDRSGALGVLDGRGRWLQGQVSPGSFVAPWLVIIRWRPDIARNRWRPEGARLDRTILLLPDMLSREDFRKLRVLLRWG